MTEIDTIREFVDVSTGDMLPATTDNAARAIEAAREMKRRADFVIRDATGWLAEEATRLGTKTMHTGERTVTLTGGPSTEIDPVELESLLREAGCPEERIRQAVKTEVTYKVDRSVLRQLSMNPDYQAAIELATTEVVKPWTTKVA